MRNGWVHAGFNFQLGTNVNYKTLRDEFLQAINRTGTDNQTHNWQKTNYL